MIRGGARFIFNPPTRINHTWLMETNHQNLGEITDLHESEQQMMQIWNDFLLNIRITHLGRKMIYKALVGVCVGDRVRLQVSKEETLSEGICRVQTW